MTRMRFAAVGLVLACVVAACAGPAPTAPRPTPGLERTPGATATPGASSPSSTQTASSPVGPAATAAPSRPPTTTAPNRPPTTTAPSRPPTPSAPPAPAHPAPPASCSIPTALLGKDLTTIPSARKVVALTFDGGSGNESTDRILATLAAEGVPATFFLTGRFVNAHPATARLIAAAHPIGNHTQDHPDLTKLDDAAVRAQLDRGNASIRAATGVDPRPYFRFPFGAVDARRIGLANEACYVPFRWTTDTLGWQGTSGGRSAASVTQRVLDQARPGGIVLMHLGAHPTDRSTLDADALPAVIAGLRARGYAFVTLEAVLPAAP